MPAATNWRLVGVETLAGGDLEMLELTLFVGDTRVDASATLTSSHPPKSGTLADLKDGTAAVACTFDATAVRAGGFYLRWDFATVQDITSVKVTRVAPSTSLVSAQVQALVSGQWLTVATSYADPAAQVSTLAVSAAPQLVGWLASAAACSQNGGADRWDAANTSHANWAERFSAFQSVGAYTSGTTNAPIVTKTITRFIPGEPWDVFAYNGTYNGDYAILDIEFLAGSTVVAAVACRSNASFSNALRVGTSIGTMTQMPVYGSYQTVNGKLVASADGIRYTPLEGTSANTTAFFYAANLSGVNALRITVQAYTGYTAAFSLAARAYLRVMTNVTPGNPAPSPRGDATRPTFVAFSAPVLPVAIAATPGAQTARDIEYGGRGRFAATVKEKNTPANTPLRRRVRLLDERNGMVVREVWSDAETGDYEFVGIKTGVLYTALSYDHTHSYRAVVADNLLPEVLP